MRTCSSSSGSFRGEIQAVTWDFDEVFCLWGYVDLSTCVGCKWEGGTDGRRQVSALPREPFLALSLFSTCRENHWDFRSAEKS
jgi:hypothetical protein